jgi:hypothetical protein
MSATTTACLDNNLWLRPDIKRAQPLALHVNANMHIVFSAICRQEGGFFVAKKMDFTHILASQRSKSD